LISFLTCNKYKIIKSFELYADVFLKNPTGKIAMLYTAKKFSTTLFLLEILLYFCLMGKANNNLFSNILPLTTFASTG